MGGSSLFFLAGLLRSTLLYGLVTLVICLFVLGVPLTVGSGGFIGGFFDFMSVSTVFYPVLLLVHPMFAWFGRRRRGMKFSYFQTLFHTLGADLTNPFRGLVALKGASKAIDSKGFYGAYAWGQVIVHLIWAIAFWIYFVTGYFLIVS